MATTIETRTEVDSFQLHCLEYESRHNPCFHYRIVDRQKVGFGRTFYNVQILICPKDEGCAQAKLTDD